MQVIIEGYLETKGLDLVELIYRYEGRGMVLRVLTDRPEGGITLGECTLLNRQISAILEEKGLIEEGYALEVSSPGVDRPLKTKSDFLRCLNKKAHFFLNEQVAEKLEVEGNIKKVENTSLYIERDGLLLEIPLSKINKAKQILIRADNLRRPPYNFGGSP